MYKKTSKDVRHLLIVFVFFHFQMVQAIQVLRFHLLELEKVSSGFLPDMRSSALCSKMGKISTFKLARLLQRLKSLDFVVIHAYITLIALSFPPLILEHSALAVAQQRPPAVGCRKSRQYTVVRDCGNECKISHINHIVPEC